ncbi:arsenate reductase family protein [Akkermansiaceae bacterium]|nr:arsenate reductase family protein [Akkermansiaceae bacterium]
MLQFYAYKGCDSCRKARKWLQENSISFQELAIRETPPSLQELQFALKSQGSLKPLFNTSGMDYRSMGMKDKLPTISDTEALELLAANGNLIKRPFLIHQEKGIHLTGFKETTWADTLTA